MVTGEGKKVGLSFLSCLSRTLGCPSVSCCLNTSFCLPHRAPVYPNAQRAPHPMLVSCYSCLCSLSLRAPPESTTFQFHPVPDTLSVGGQETSSLLGSVDPSVKWADEPHS